MCICVSNNHEYPRTWSENFKETTQVLNHAGFVALIIKVPNVDFFNKNSQAIVVCCNPVLAKWKCRRSTRLIVKDDEGGKEKIVPIKLYKKKYNYYKTLHKKW